MCEWRSIALLQHLLGIDEREIRIGRATVSWPADGVLLSARFEAGGAARPYGFLPSWLSSGGLQEHDVVYYSFALLDGCKEAGRVGLFEMSEAEESRTNAMLKSIDQASSGENSDIEAVRLGKLRGVVAREGNSVGVFLPVAGLKLVSGRIEFIETLEIRLIHHGNER